MAESNSFSPEFMAKLQTKAQFIEPAAKAISIFAKFPGPDGRYYADFHKIVGSFDSKSGAPVFTFAYVCLASVETGSQEYIGHPFRIRFACKASEKQTEQEAWNRLFTDGYQAMGIQTSKWKNPMQDVQIATEFLNKSKFPVVLSVKKNAQGFTNINIVEVLNRDAVKHLVIPDIQISDDQLNQSDDETQSQMLDETVDNFNRAYKEAEDFLNKADQSTLLAQIAESEIEVENPGSLSMSQLRSIILSHFIIQSGRDPAEFGLSPSSYAPEETQTKGDGEPHIAFDENGEEVLVKADSSTEQPIGTEGVMEELEEALEEKEELIEEADEDPQAKLVEAIRLLDRTGLKKAIIKYKADTKFFQNMTDEFLGQMLFDHVVANNNEIRW